ncbi:hypothetical protein [Nitrosopumilus sp. S4]
MSSALIVPVQAQTTSEFGYQLHPGKLLENTEGILQIFVESNEMMVPREINNPKAISSDNSIIEILRIEDGNDEFTKNVIIKAKKPGITSIALAASGFSSKEITLEVFNNNNFPTQILMKATPELFPIDGPRIGNIAIELATTGGLPTRAFEDVKINIYTPNDDVIKIRNSELTIMTGDYYVITEFDIIGTGDAIIFAEVNGMKKISKIINVLEPKKPLQLKLYVYPENYNSFSGTTGYAIVQLLDGEGIPVIAEKDISFKLGVENPDISINSSHDFEEINFDKKQLVIEKGSYSTYTKFSPRPNVGEFTESFENEYTMFISANNILTNDATFTVTHDQIGALEGKGPSITKTLPFLTSGKSEIIAVTYYETDIEVSRQTGGSTQGNTNRELVTVTVPVQAKENHEVSFSASELDTINPKNPTMKKGENAVIVFGEAGTVAPETQVNFYVTDNEGVKTVNGKPIGPIKDQISLLVEPLIPIILADSEFPVLAYLIEAEEDEETEIVVEDEDEEVNTRLGITPFIEDGILTFSANDDIDTNSLTIKKNQPFVKMNLISKEVGTTTLSYQMKGFEGSTEISSQTTDPAEIYLVFPKNVLTNSNTLATVQLLDSAKNPVYANKDIRIQLVSNNEQVLQIPDELTIKKGEYFSTFELGALEEGKIELALLSEDFALSKYEINVIDITPVLTLDLLGTLNWDERIEAKLKISIPEIETSLAGFEVEWVTEGGEVRSSETITNSEGIAVLNIIANDGDTVSISATVSGNSLNSATIQKTVEILNVPEIEEIVEEESSSFGLPLDMTTMIIIVIPIGIGAVLFFLKRTERLEMITEKIPIGDKIEGIKEKISDIRNR